MSDNPPRPGEGRCSKRVLWAFEIRQAASEDDCARNKEGLRSYAAKIPRSAEVDIDHVVATQAEAFIRLAREDGTGHDERELATGPKEKFNATNDEES